jgi:hypothetical protein
MQLLITSTAKSTLIHFTLDKGSCTCYDLNHKHTEWRNYIDLTVFSILRANKSIAINEIIDDNISTVSDMGKSPLM